MMRSEVLAIIANTPEDELGDILLECAVQYWLDKGTSPDEIVFLTESVLEDAS
jgi:hypothetical protein